MSFLELAAAFLACVGLWISVYFTGVAFKWFSPNVFWVPRVCRLGEKSCLYVLETPRAKFFGVPNSVFGIFMYLYVLADLFFFPPHFGLFLTAVALARSLYLAYSLLFVTKVPCVLCFTSHAVNLALFLFYLAEAANFGSITT